MAIPKIRTVIDKYRVYLEHDSVRVELFKQKPGGQLTQLGFLQFTDSEAPTAELRGPTLYVVMPRAAYADAIDLLRNESPVLLRTHPESARGWLQTGAEAAGEGEGA